MPTRSWIAAFTLGATLSLLWACSPERPPQPDETARGRSEGSQTAGPARFDPSAGPFVLTYAGDRGEFSDCQVLDEVPANARGMVGVNVFGIRPPAGKVWVCNLDQPDAKGAFALQPVARERFEEVILGSGRASAVDLPEGIELPDVEPALEGAVIVYKTSWCGVCKQLVAYLDRRGVEYITKDIEEDPAAAAELAAKAKTAGVKMGSVPMIDVGGEILRGFDRARLEELL